MTLDALASRVLVFGIPAAIGMCGWGLLEIVNNGRQLERVLTSVEFMQKAMISHDDRIDRLEGEYFRKHP